MKNKVTWIVVSNSQTAFVVANEGPRTGFVPVAGHVWEAPELVGYSDEPGVMQSSFGPGRPSMTTRDLKREGQKSFAAEIMDHLVKAQREKAFDRIVLTGTPQMLGALRDVTPTSIKAALLAELDKDLTKIPPAELGAHLRDIMRL